MTRDNHRRDKPRPVVLAPCDGTEKPPPLIRVAKMPDQGCCIQHNAVGHLVHWEWTDRRTKAGRSRPCMRHTGYCAYCLGDVDASREPRKAFWLAIFSGSPPSLRVIEYGIHAVSEDERLDPAWQGSLRGQWLRARKVHERKNASVVISIEPSNWRLDALPPQIDLLAWCCRLWDVGGKYELLPEVSTSEHLLPPWGPDEDGEVPNPPPDVDPRPSPP